MRTAPGRSPGPVFDQQMVAFPVRLGSLQYVPEVSVCLQEVAERARASGHVAATRTMRSSGVHVHALRSASFWLGSWQLSGAALHAALAFCPACPSRLTRGRSPPCSEPWTCLRCGIPMPGPPAAAASSAATAKTTLPAASALPVRAARRRPRRSRSSHPCSDRAHPARRSLARRLLRARIWQTTPAPAGRRGRQLPHPGQQACLRHELAAGSTLSTRQPSGDSRQGCRGRTPLPALRRWMLQM